MHGYQSKHAKFEARNKKNNNKKIIKKVTPPQKKNQNKKKPPNKQTKLKKLKTKATHPSI